MITYPETYDLLYLIQMKVSVSTNVDRIIVELVTVFHLNLFKSVIQIIEDTGSSCIF